MNWYHATLSCNFTCPVPRTRSLQCARSSFTSNFTRIDTAVIASVALRLKNTCCGDVRFSHWRSFWNFVARSLRGLELLLPAVPTAGCFSCLNVCSCVLHSLLVRVHPTQAIWRCSESSLRSAHRVVVTNVLHDVLDFLAV